MIHLKCKIKIKSKIKTIIVNNNHLLNYSHKLHNQIFNYLLLQIFLSSHILLSLSNSTNYLLLNNNNILFHIHIQYLANNNHSIWILHLLLVIVQVLILTNRIRHRKLQHWWHRWWPCFLGWLDRIIILIIVIIIKLEIRIRIKINKKVKIIIILIMRKIMMISCWKMRI